MLEVVKDSMLAKLKEKKIFPMLIDDEVTMPKSQLSLEHNNSGSILGRVDTLFVLKQSELTKK